MMIEHRLQPSLVRLQRPSHHFDLVETIAVHFDQGQDFTADRRQFLLDPDRVYDGEFDQLCNCSSALFPIAILMGLCQREKMTLKKLASEEKGRAVLQRKVQRGRGNADHRLEERELDLREVVEPIVEQAVQSIEKRGGREIPAE